MKRHYRVALEGHRHPGASTWLTLEAAVDSGHYRLVRHDDVATLTARGATSRIISRTRANQGDLRLAALPPKVRRVLQIVGFDRYSAIFDTAEEALQDF